MKQPTTAVLRTWALAVQITLGDLPPVWIDARCLRDVFERLNTRSEGTGIGLAIIRHIAESCGGRAWLEAAPGGNGCRLCFE